MMRWLVLLEETARLRVEQRLSQARSKLGVALAECHVLHDSLVSDAPAASPCSCAGCRIKRSIDLALEELES